MKHSLFGFVLIIAGVLLVHGGDRFIDFLQLENGGVGIQKTKLPMLQSFACVSNSPDYCAANALLAAHYIHADESDVKFTKAYRHAIAAFDSPLAKWEKIYAGLTLATIEGSCYRQNYSNQISVITAVLREISINEWESTANPVYSFLKQNSVRFDTDMIRELLLLQLVNAYCRIEQDEKAEQLVLRIDNVAAAQRARGLIALERKIKADKKLRENGNTTKEEGETQR